MSNQFIPDQSLFSSLKDKVVVVSGGSSGIGAATVRLLHSAGASVVFGDLPSTASAAKELHSSLSSPSSVTFHPFDASSYASNVSLFRTALQSYGHVDHAVACAGVLEQGKWFDPDLTVEQLEEEEQKGEDAAPTTRTLDVNLTGTIFFTRAAVVYLRHGNSEAKQDKTITLLSSVAAFRQSPGLPLYQASKHGVLGLMRSLRSTIYPRDHIRINAICPGMTNTQMTSHMISTFRSANLGINTPADVANIILGLQANSPHPRAPIAQELEESSNLATAIATAAASKRVTFDMESAKAAARKAVQDAQDSDYEFAMRSGGDFGAVVDKTSPEDVEANRSPVAAAATNGTNGVVSDSSPPPTNGHTANGDVPNGATTTNGNQPLSSPKKGHQKNSSSIHSINGASPVIDTDYEFAMRSGGDFGAVVDKTSPEDVESRRRHTLADRIADQEDYEFAMRSGGTSDSEVVRSSLGASGGAYGGGGVVEEEQEEEQEEETEDTGKALNGKAVYVDGGLGWEIEERLEASMPEWLGEFPAKRMLAAMKVSKGAYVWGSAIA